MGQQNQEKECAEKQYTVLVCDDDEDIRSALQIYLHQAGYQVVQAADGQEAVTAIQAADPPVHLVLLDVMMPELDGIQTIAKIRETSNLPVLFLSAKSEDTDRILGLNMGGDDYITKPFNPVELLARVQAALRRYARLGGLAEPSEVVASTLAGPTIPDGLTAPGAPGAPGAPAGSATGTVPAAPGAGAPGAPAVPAANQPTLWQTGDIILDDLQKRVTVAGVDANLTAREYSILKLLISNIERVYSSAQIYEAVWNEPAFNVSKTVSVHIRHIREKIEINPKEPSYLKVVYGLGYKVVKLK